MDLNTSFGTTRNYRATANLHTSQSTTAPAKPFPAGCLQQPIPGNGFYQWRFFIFPRSRCSFTNTRIGLPTIYFVRNSQSNSLLQPLHLLCCSANWQLRRLNYLRLPIPGWRPFHTNLLVSCLHSPTATEHSLTMMPQFLNWPSRF
jgi:hypothetical protein